MVDSLEDAERIFADQLDRLRVDYFDFYLVHALNKNTWEKMERLGVYALLERYKRRARSAGAWLLVPRFARRTGGNLRGPTLGLRTDSAELFGLGAAGRQEPVRHHRAGTAATAS